MSVTRTGLVVLDVAAFLAALSIAIGCAAESTGDPTVKNPAPQGKSETTWTYTSPIRGAKPYPEGRALLWSDVSAKSIESADRKQDPWLKGPGGATHPVVLFDPKDLPKIRARLKRGAGPRILSHVRRNAQRGGIADSGLYAALTGDKSFATKAIPKLIAVAAREPGKALLRNGGQLATVALGYDLLYNYMTPDQRTNVRARLDKIAQTMFLRKLSHTSGNWLPHCWGALGIAGFALQEENRYAESWILLARVANVRYMHSTFDPDGAGYEAFSRYFAMGMNKVLICFAAERRQGRDFFTYRDSIFGRIVEFSAYMLRPTRRAWVAFDDAFLIDVDFPATFAAIAGLTGDPLAQGVFESVYPAPRMWVGNAVMAAAWYNPDVPAERPADSKRLSLARAYRGAPAGRKHPSSSGHVFLRTGFDKQQDILFAAQCGDTGGWHGHADQTGFSLYAYGDVLVQDPAIIGSYHEPLCEWMKGPEAHSIVLIDGQATPDYSVGNRLNWPRRFSHAGEVDALVHTGELDLVSMDFREGLALNPELGKARQAKRYVLFFRHPERQGYFVIIDDVVQDGAARHYEWLAHPDDKHKVVKEGPGRFAFTGKVDLKIRMIEPPDPAHSTATFEGYGVNYLRLRSKEDRKRGLFFTVLYPLKKGMAMPRIAQVRERDVIGARIGEDLVLFRTEPGGGIDAAGVRSNGELVALRIADGTVRKALVLGGTSLTRKGGNVEFVKPGPRDSVRRGGKK